MIVSEESGKFDVIGFGALNVDQIYRVSDDTLSAFRKQFGLKRGGEVFLEPDMLGPVLGLLSCAKRLMQSGGGSAANAIFALAKMGFNVSYIGKVGRDEYGKFLVGSLAGVDTNHIQKGDRSGLAVILLNEEGERSILIFPNCNDDLTYDEVSLDYIRRARFLHLGSFKGDKPLDAQEKVVAAVSSAVEISFDPGEIYARKGLGRLASIISRSFVVFATEGEINLLTGKPWENGAKELLRCGAHIVVCKLGGEGSVVLTLHQRIDTSAESVEVTDTTGAGDVFAAGFLAGLLLELPLDRAARLASKAAAQSITGYGRERYPDKAFLEKAVGT